MNKELNEVIEEALSAFILELCKIFDEFHEKAEQADKHECQCGGKCSLTKVACDDGHYAYQKEEGDEKG